jgi:hypothetical protein
MPGSSLKGQVLDLNAGEVLTAVKAIMLNPIKSETQIPSQTPPKTRDFRKSNQVAAPENRGPIKSRYEHVDGAVEREDDELAAGDFRE